MSVAIVMPEIGFDEVPMMPTMRRRDGHEEEAEDDDEERPSASEPGNGPCGKPGRTAMMSARTIEPTTTMPMPRSSLGADRVFASPARRRSDFTDSRNAETIVGSVLMSVITPAQATAPAPM